jgi:hypothetical protein
MCCTHRLLQNLKEKLYFRNLGVDGRKYYTLKYSAQGCELDLETFMFVNTVLYRQKP